MTKRFPAIRDIRAVALLISYDGELPAEELRNLMRRGGHVGRANRADGTAYGSNSGVYARRCIGYLRTEGLARVEGVGKSATVFATVPLSELADWLACALEQHEEHEAGLYERTDTPWPTAKIRSPASTGT